MIMTTKGDDEDAANSDDYHDKKSGSYRHPHSKSNSKSTQKERRNNKNYKNIENQNKSKGKERLQKNDFEMSHENCIVVDESHNSV